MFFENLDLISVGIAVAATVVLGISVYFNKSDSQSNRSFFYFSIITAAWGVTNYLAYQFTNERIILWLFRLVLFFAIWQAFTIFHFFYVFPLDKKRLSTSYKYLLIPMVALTSLTTLTPFIFSGVAEVIKNGASKTIVEPGIFLFGIVAVGLVISGIIIIFRKLSSVEAEEKTSIRLILLGASLMFSLIITFNFIIAGIFLNVTYIPFGALFVFPFIAFTSYAILRHKLFNLKIAGTAVLVFLLAVVMFSEVILARELSLVIYRSVVFVLVLAFGIILIRGVLREVRQREIAQELNKSLKALDEARSEFISMASHQLRTPLTAIVGYLSMMKEGDFGKVAEALIAPVDRVFLSARRLMNIVETLLDVSRIEAGRFEIAPEAMDLLPMAKRLVEDFQIQARDKSLRLSLETQPQLPNVYADPLKAEDVLTNLIDNALKYTDEGSVTVRLAALPGFVQCCVEDTGMGMDADEASQIFKQYTRGERASGHSVGLGMGLYIGERVVTAHGGKIWVNSAGKDRGSTFCFTLPIHGSDTKS